MNEVNKIHQTDAVHSTDAVIIGAGPVGLAMAKSFQAANIPYEHVEADDDVGGNWYHGTYQSAHILSAQHD